MITVGVLQAKTQLSSLLDKVAAGEEVVITRHGKPLARLVSTAEADRENRLLAVKKLKELQKANTLGGLSWKELRDAGRKY